MNKTKILIFEIILLLIIATPSFLSLTNNKYFSMHDDQHIARLFLLDKGIKQGYLYPRWVDILGFGYGYPLFNFYPPFVYYIAEIFHLLGFSLIWSIKLTFVLGFFVAVLGIYIFVKKIAGKLAGFLSATLYTYFFYHAVISYVRGALAEFFSLAIIPFVFISLDYLSANLTFKGSVFFGTIFALLILTHPLIAFPCFLFIGFFLVFYLTATKRKIDLIKYFLLGLTLALSLSCFFWLPSIIEKKYTLVDEILTKELANYKIHYIYPQQFLYSPWGYGGSIAGPYDGMTFQLGKIHLFLWLCSLLLSLFYYFRTKKMNYSILYYLFFNLLLLFSLFMTTQFSSFIWDHIKYLWYLQFPWRFLTFGGFFISVVAGYFVFFLIAILPKKIAKIANFLPIVLVMFFILITIFIYRKYFKPQQLLAKTDKELTTYEEIAWRVSRTSFEFVPKGVKTTKSNLKTTILDINKNDLPKKPYEIISTNAKVKHAPSLRSGLQPKQGSGVRNPEPSRRNVGTGSWVKIIQNKFADKKFLINTPSPIVFQLNTYNFPGWKAYLDNKSSTIKDNNDYKLISVDIPKGNHQIVFRFEDTLIRKITNIISLFTLIMIVFYWLKPKISRF